MYADLDAASKRALAQSQFAAAYEGAQRTATATHLTVTGKARDGAGGVSIPVEVQTRLFGTLPLTYTLRTVGESSGPRIAWSRSVAFPGLTAGEQLTRHTSMPARASLLARDGTRARRRAPSTTTASTPSEATRSSPLGEAGSAVDRRGRAGPVLAGLRTGSEGRPADRRWSG